MHCCLDGEGIKGVNFNPQGYKENYGFSPCRSDWAFMLISHMFNHHQCYDTNVLRHAQAYHCQE